MPYFPISVVLPQWCIQRWLIINNATIILNRGTFYSSDLTTVYYYSILFFLNEIVIRHGPVLSLLKA